MLDVFPFADEDVYLDPRSYSKRNCDYWTSARDCQHCGQDVPVAIGTKIFAPRDCKLAHPDLDGSGSTAYGTHLAAWYREGKGDDARFIIWMFAHLSWKERGYAAAEAGALIAKSGNSGSNTTGAHCHVERYVVDVDEFSGTPSSWSGATWNQVWRSRHSDPYPALREAQKAA